MMSNELKEKVARAICEEDGNSYYPHLKYTEQAQAAMDVIADWLEDYEIKGRYKHLAKRLRDKE